MRLICLSLLAFVAVALRAQEASLSASQTQLAARGGVVTITAHARYSTTPAVLGWSVKLPSGWKLHDTMRAGAPEIAPAQGATGTLEWAYITVPTDAARFDFTVTYPAGADLTQVITGDLVLRSNGETSVVHTPPLVLRRASTATRGQQTE